MRALGIDFGERRIGVAVSDELGIMARPLSVVERTSRAEDIARIGEFASKRKVEMIVVGLPLNMDGSPGPAARRARRFAAALRRELGLQVELWDERLTTAEADRALIASGQRRARRRELRDGVAASLILQSYLEARQRNRRE
ncbi:MAG: Holliday junction resolvase RuvX [Armatimonadota bacterium]|nr:MAG: Holliday junction resolvase RuvX [Armatimonadota bacterium]